MPRAKKNLTLTEDEFTFWKQRIADGREWNKKIRKETKKYRMAWHGEFPKPYPEEGGDEQVYVNWIHRVGLQWIAAMYAQNPQIDLEPPNTQGGTEEKAVAYQEAILNTEIRRAGMEEPMRRDLQTAFLDGWAILKSGFHADIEYEDEGEEELSTDAEAENHGFELGPEFFPTRVALREDHEEHLERHEKEREQTENKLRNMQESIKAAQEQWALQQQQMAQNPPAGGGMPPMAGAEQQGMGMMTGPQDGTGPMGGMPPGGPLPGSSPPGGEMPIMPEQIQELQRLAGKIQAIQKHEDEHRAKMEERDRKGENPTDIRIKSESVWVATVHNSNFIWDVNATGPHDWRWVAERFIKPLSHWKAQDRFKHKEDIGANFTRPKPGTRGNEEDGVSPGGVDTAWDKPPGGAVEDEDDPDALAAMWKIWDIEKRRIIWFHEGCDKPNLVEKWPHRFLKTAPHRMLYFELKEDEFQPVSPMTHIWSQQLEVNRYRTKAGIITRRYARCAVASDRMSPDEVELLQEAKDGTIVRVNVPIGQRAKDVIAPVEWGGVPPDVYNLGSIAEDDIMKGTGLGETSLGSGIKAKTATAAKVQEATVGVTLDIKLKAIERLVAEVAGDLRGLMRQYYREERFVPLFWEGAKTMEGWKGADLQDFSIKIKFGSSRAQKDEVEKMQALQMLQSLAPVPGINIQKLAKRVLSAFSIVDPDSFFLAKGQQGPQDMKAPPPPGQGQGQQEMPNRGQQAQPSADLAKVGGAPQ